jgi:thioredoxin 1
MTEDKELSELRRKRLEDMMRRKQEEPVSQKVDTTVEVTDLNFVEAVGKGGLVVIDCWAVWCAPCRMISPIIEELAKDYAGKIVFGKLNVDENHEVALKYQIMSIPTILVFKNGNLVDRIVGAMPRRLLEPRITQHLSA